MSETASLPARAAIALLVGLAGLAGAIAFSSPAAAHSAIIDSTPEAGEELAAAPETFSITANEDLADVTGTGEGFALRIVSVATGEDLSTGQLTIDGPTLSTPGVELAGGAYLMQYQVVSADGHPVSGEIPFTIAGGDGPTGGEPADAGDDGEQNAVPAGEPTWPLWAAAGVVLAVAAVVTAIVAVRRRR